MSIDGGCANAEDARVKTRIQGELFIASFVLSARRFWGSSFLFKTGACAPSAEPHHPPDTHPDKGVDRYGLDDEGMPHHAGTRARVISPSYHAFLRDLQRHADDDCRPFARCGFELQ